MVIMLLSWQSFFSLDSSMEYQVVEYFAGVGRIARLSSAHGYVSGAFDVEIPGQHPQHFGYLDPPDEHERKTAKNLFVQRAMDLTSSPGFT